MSCPGTVLDIREFTGRDVLERLGSEIDALAEHVDVPLTSRRPWLSGWLDACPQYQPWVVSAWESQTLIGACLLAHRRVGGWEEVVAIGDGRNDRTRFLAADADVAQALARRVSDALQRCHRPWSLDVGQLPRDDAVAAELAEQLPWAVLVPGGSVPGVDFAEHASPELHLTKNLRRQLQKCRNRLAKDVVHARITFTRDRQVLWSHLDEIEEVHRARDHDVGRTSDIDDPAGRRLWRTVIATHIERDEVEIATMRLDGALAAYVVSFLDQSTYRVFDGRFVTKWARYSPGRLLEAETLAHAMADRGFDRLDWMNSVAPDKLLSANTLEPTMHLIASSSWNAALDGRADADAGPSTTCARQAGGVMTSVLRATDDRS